MEYLEWKRSEKLVSMEKIEEIESIIGIKFPSDFIECAMVNHGSRATLDLIMINGYERVFGNLLSFSEESAENIISIYDGAKERLLKGIYPFGIDPAGNLFCFDYRNSINPNVIFWRHELAVIASDYSEEELKTLDLASQQEKAVEFISNSFTEFLDLLYGDDFY